LADKKDEKFRAPKTKLHTNPNDSNSKFQTNPYYKAVFHGMVTSIPKFVERILPMMVNVLVIGYWKLRFICNLVLEIWNFID